MEKYTYKYVLTTKERNFKVIGKQALIETNKKSY